MDPLEMQFSIRQNSNELTDYYNDLKQWGEDMKRKDEALKSNVSKSQNKIKKKDGKETCDPNLPVSVEKQKIVKKKKPIKGVDYTAWDKYDVEAECAKIDNANKDSTLDYEEEDSSDLSDESDESNIDHANCEKEKGNTFVKSQKWDKAIACYTKAIEYYAYNPIFYANRALCYLKQKNYASAEADCTSALQLDKTYVKAYQRRAAAREALNQLTEARNDLLKVFDYEPNNKESKKALSSLETKLKSSGKSNLIKKSPKENLEKAVEKPTSSNEQKQQGSEDKQKPVSIFTASRQNRKAASAEKQPIFNRKLPSTYWPSGNEVELVRPIEKAPHSRSKAPLRRVPIRNAHIETLPSPKEDGSLSILSSDLKIIEHKNEDDVLIQGNLKEDSISKNDEKKSDDVLTEESGFSFEIPKSSVQFYSDWKAVKDNSEWKYCYLKQVDPANFATIFKESLESDLFSQILRTLSQAFVERRQPVFDYLLGLSQVKRFSMLVMFMSEEDKTDLLKLFEYMKSDVNLSNSKVSQLLTSYGIE